MTHIPVIRVLLQIRPATPEQQLKVLVCPNCFHTIAAAAQSCARVCPVVVLVRRHNQTYDVIKDREDISLNIIIRCSNVRPFLRENIKSEGKMFHLVFVVKSHDDLSNLHGNQGQTEPPPFI
jgi:hypothetical protein